MPHLLLRLMCTTLAVVIGGCSNGEDTWIALGTLERDRIELTADTNEPITNIFVDEGQPVKAGEPLLQQNTDRAEAVLARAMAEEAVAQAALAEAEKGPRAQAIDQARSRVEAARSARVTARAEMDRQISLVQRNFSSPSTVDVLKGRYEEALAREEEARSALDELMEGTRNERIDQARSAHAAAVANVRDISISVERATLRSPVDGRVEALPFELGERPLQGATVAVVLAGHPTYARVHIPEPLRTQLQPGARALVRIDSHELPLPAKVRWIAADATFTPYYALNQHDRTRLSFVAEIDLEDGADLPVGIPVEVTFPGIGP